MTVGSSSRIQNHSIPYLTTAHIPEKVPIHPKSRSCLVSTHCFIILFSLKRKLSVWFYEKKKY